MVNGQCKNCQKNFNFLYFPGDKRCKFHSNLHFKTHWKSTLYRIKSESYRSAALYNQNTLHNNNKCVSKSEMGELGARASLLKSNRNSIELNISMPPHTLFIIIIRILHTHNNNNNNTMTIVYLFNFIIHVFLTEKGARSSAQSTDNKTSTLSVL